MTKHEFLALVELSFDLKKVKVYAYPDNEDEREDCAIDYIFEQDGFEVLMHRTACVLPTEAPTFVCILPDDENGDLMFTFPPSQILEFEDSYLGGILIHRECTDPYLYGDEV